MVPKSRIRTGSRALVRPAGAAIVAISGEDANLAHMNCARMPYAVTLLMFLAWLAHGAMSALACGNAPVAGISAGGQVRAAGTGLESRPHHAGHGVTSAGRSDAGKPCPHRSDMTHAAVCSGCLLVVPIAPASGGRDVSVRYPPPGLARRLIAAVLAPVLPPPRPAILFV